MRVVVIVIASLVTLGLAAFGIGAAQKSAGPTSIVAMVAHAVSPARPSATVPAPAEQHAAARPVANPVAQISDAPVLPDCPFTKCR